MKLLSFFEIINVLFIPIERMICFTRRRWRIFRSVAYIWLNRTCGKPPLSGGLKKHCHEAGVGTGSTVRGVAGASSSLVVGARSEETHSRRRGDNTEGGRREHHHHHHHHHHHAHHHHDTGSREGSSNSPLIWIDDGRLYIGQSWCVFQLAFTLSLTK